MRVSVSVSEVRKQPRITNRLSVLYISILQSTHISQRHNKVNIRSEHQHPFISRLKVEESETQLIAGDEWVEMK